MMQQMSKGDMNIPGMDQMFGSGVKGKLGKMAMNRMIKKIRRKRKNGNKMKKQLRYRLKMSTAGAFLSAIFILY